MIRSLLLSLTALASLSSFSTSAQATELREAWLSASAFDGKTFKYQYIAYDAQEPVRDQVKINCDYTHAQGSMLLKSVEVKVFIEADFNRSGEQVKRSGTVDIRKAVNDCQKVLPGKRNAVQSPVAIKLPQISISSQE